MVPVQHPARAGAARRLSFRQAGCTVASFSAIYLGTGPLIDQVEGNTSADHAGALVGQTFGGPGNALAGNVTGVVTGDLNGDGALNQDNFLSSDGFTADIGNGDQNFAFDAATAYSATVTYTDGSTANVTLVVFQSTTGETFLAPGLTAGVNAILTAAPIRSITLNGTVTTNATGLAVDRPDIDFPTCLVAGTRIATPAGPRPVEALRPGDIVLTRDRGPRPLVWAGRRTAAGTGAFAPVRLLPGALGRHGLVEVSQQHRVLVSGWRAELHFATGEVLVAARHLVNGRTVLLAPRPQVSYVHLMFDRHEIVTTAGLASESFYPGAVALAGDAALRAELAALFPGLAAAAPWPLARPVVAGPEAALLLA